MKFMISMVVDESSSGQASPEEMQEMGEKMGVFMSELQEAGALHDQGARLAPSTAARTLRYGQEGEPVVTDGPFAESKEQMAGYMVLECADLDEAVAWVEKLPVLGTPAIEVRPIADASG